MAVTIGASFLLYGLVPRPIIPGFTVVSRKDYWLTATDGTRNYILGANDSHWLFWECYYSQDWVSPSNQAGMRMAKDYPGGVTPENADIKISKDGVTEEQ